MFHCRGRRGSHVHYGTEGGQGKKITLNSELRTLNSRGFTLFEIMVAVTIMSMVLVTLIGLKNSSMQDVALAEHITTATMLAKAKMLETIKSGRLDAVEEDGEYPAQENLMQYTWKRTISKIPVPNGQYLTEIRVATLWNEGTRPEIVELVDYE
jgi:prepilin-type N-terminal cleavage/methylation domain-containing protein